MNNPFLTAKPVPAEHFVGRAVVVRRIFAALISNSHNIVLVDLPRSGKTSLLTYTRSQQARLKHLVGRTEDFLFASFDCSKLPSRYQGSDFWRFITSQINDPSLREPVAEFQAGAMETLDVQRFLDTLKQARRKLVLHIDELDVLLRHPHLGTCEFLAAFRSLSEDSSLSIVAASNLTVEHLNNRTEHEYGSPKFNYFQNERLGAFSDDEVDDLLTHYLRESASVFDAADHAWIKRTAGGFPYLAQAAAWILFDLAAHSTHSEAQWEAARPWLQQQTEEFCRRVYLTLSHRARQFLSLVVLSGQPTVSRSEHDLALTELVDQSLIERTAGRWRVRADCLAWWIARHAPAASATPVGEALHIASNRHPRLRLFISAAEKDVEFCTEIEDHLAAHGHVVDCQHRGKIPPGTNRSQWLLHEVRTADIILVLLSAEHLNDSLGFSSDSELGIALSRAAAGHAELIPILAHAVTLANTPFAGLRLLPMTQHPVRTLRHRAHAWAEVIKHVTISTCKLSQFIDPCASQAQQRRTASQR